MHANTSIYNAQMYAHVITLFASIPFTCMYSGVRATGVFFDDVLALDYNYPSHILIYAQGNALLRKFFMYTESVKITLFRSFCTSLYTCELWCQYRSESLRKLCVAYNNVFRFLCREPRNCSASHMFVSRGLPTCNMLIRKSIYAFMTSTKRSCNSILQNIVGSDHIYTSPLRQHWRRMLYVHAY